MKKQTLLLSTFFLMGIMAFGQSVGINTDNSAPDNSAMLDVKSSSKGILVPRVALTGTSDNTTISSPATSLLVYNTATISDITPGFYFWNGSGWSSIAGAAASATSSNIPNTIVKRDASGDFSAGTITASLTGAASENILRTGDIMTGYLMMGSAALGGATNPILFEDASGNKARLKAPISITADYTLTLPTTAGTSGYALITDGAGNLSWTDLSSSGKIQQGGNAFGSNIVIGSNDAYSLNFISGGSSRFNISSTGQISIPAFTSAGILHNSATTGNLSSSLIVNSDIDASASIADTKLATITSSGKVSNSATTATSSNTVSTIVMRDGSGNFSAGAITASSGLTVSNGTVNIKPSGSGGSSGQVLTSDGSGNASWQTAGGLTMTTVSGPTTLSTANQFVYVTGVYTITLPASPATGQLLYFLTDNTAASLNPNGKFFRQGAADWSTSTFSDFGSSLGGLILIYNGSKWFPVSSN
jgi:trimeric autotransporter adhesin